MLWDQHRTWKFENTYYVNLDLKLKHTKVLEILQPKQALVDINWASFGVEQVHRVWWHFTWEWHRSHSTR